VHPSIHKNIFCVLSLHPALSNNISHGSLSFSLFSLFHSLGTHSRDSSLGQGSEINPMLSRAVATGGIPTIPTAQLAAPEVSGLTTTGGGDHDEGQDSFSAPSEVDDDDQEEKDENQPR
jgi:hypothetical protein